MSLHRGLGTTVAVALTVAACATTVRVPEIPILDNTPFKAAVREPDPKPPVKIVEVPKPLPLPGQLKPVPEKKDRPKDEKEPKERVKNANADARVEPAKDGYINAIQVYPYTKGALYQLYAAPAQVTDIALEPGEKLVSVSAGDTVRWVVGDTTSGEGKDAIVHILVKPIGADLETPGATEVTAGHREGPRKVVWEGATYLCPTIVRCDSFDHPLANREFLCPYASVVEVPQSGMLDRIGPSLVVTAITRDPEFTQALLASPLIERLNLGPISTMKISWDQPHEGNMFEFLYRRRSIDRSDG